MLVLATLVLPVAALSLLIYVVTEKLLKPSWYRHSQHGHKNRPAHLGLPKQVGGAATTLWRISEEIDGLGDPKETFGFDYKEVEIPLVHVRNNNRTLRGWWVPFAKDNDLCVITIHGGGRDRRAFLRHLPVFANNDCSVLMFDYEEHGISDGRQRGLGWCTYEPDNVLAAVSYAKNILKYKHIVLVGTSMGGAAAIVAAGLGFKHHRTKKLPYQDPREHIDAVVSENPFFSRYSLMRSILEAHCFDFLGQVGPVVLEPLIRLVLWVGLWRVSDSEYANPLDAVKEIDVPLCIMHGTGDTLIPHTHSEMLYRHATKAKHKDLWIVEGAVHTALHNVQPNEWESHVLSVIKHIRRRK